MRGEIIQIPLKANHHRPASETPFIGQSSAHQRNAIFKRCFDGRPVMAQHCTLTKGLSDPLGLRMTSGRYILFGHRREKTCLRRFANNTGADQPAHPRSLISAFVFRFLKSITSKLYTGEIVAEQAGLNIILSETPKTGFLVPRPIYKHHHLTDSSFLFLFQPQYFIFFFLEECERILGYFS